MNKINIFSFFLFFKTLNRRYDDFKIHPLITSPKVVLIKYIYINILLRFKKKPIVINWINNLKYYLSLGDSSMITNYYFTIQDYEESILMVNYLDKEDTFVDIGSNHGHYTLLASKFTGAKVISIEPVEETRNRLKKNILINKLKNIDVIKFGISSRNGFLKISNDKGSMNRIIKGRKNNNFEKIEVTSLDVLLKNKKNVSMIKIDVEGYEKEVLLGAKNILNRENLDIIIIELNNSNKFYNYAEEETIAILKDFKFRPYKYNCKNSEFKNIKIKNYFSYNTIFIKNLNNVKRKLKNRIVISKNNKISFIY